MPTNNPSNERDDELKNEIWEYLGDMTFNCTRDWSAWQYGTMGQDDFQVARDDDDFMDSIMEIVQKHTKRAFQEGRLAGLREMDDAFIDALNDAIVANPSTEKLRSLRKEYSQPK